MTGFGLPGTGLTQGSSTQRGNLPFTPVIQFNGITAAVSFASVISPGLYQINLTVPSSVPSGDVPVTVSYNGVTGPATNYITISGGTAPPAISSFSANPPGINAGQSATLNWNVANASSLSIDNGIGAVTGSSRTVNPTATTTYKLTATNGAGSVSASTTVTEATPAPTINSSRDFHHDHGWTIHHAQLERSNAAASTSITASDGRRQRQQERIARSQHHLYAMPAAAVTGTASVTVSVQSACSIIAASDTYHQQLVHLRKALVDARIHAQLEDELPTARRRRLHGANGPRPRPAQMPLRTTAASRPMLFDNKFGTQSLTLNPEATTWASAIPVDDLQPVRSELTTR
jgi:hypothetical protein